MLPQRSPADVHIGQLWFIDQLVKSSLSLQVFRLTWFWVSFFGWVKQLTVNWALFIWNETFGSILNACRKSIRMWFWITMISGSMKYFWTMQILIQIHSTSALKIFRLTGYLQRKRFGFNKQPEDSNPGQLGKKSKCSLCVLPPPLELSK